MRVRLALDQIFVFPESLEVCKPDGHKSKPITQSCAALKTRLYDKSYLAFGFMETDENRP